MVIICNVCGTKWDNADDAVCPNCGALTYEAE
jgi:rubrerythrin